MMTQLEHFRKAHNHNAAINQHFMELVRNNDITSAELEKLIASRPSIWSRFQSWVEILKEKENADR